MSKLSHVVKDDVVKKDAYNDKVNNIADKMHGVTNVTVTTVLSVKINKVKNKISNIINSDTTTTLIDA